MPRSLPAGFLDRGGAGLEDGAQLVAFPLGVGALAAELGAQLVPLACRILAGPARAGAHPRSPVSCWLCCLRISASFRALIAARQPGQMTPPGPGGLAWHIAHSASAAGRQPGSSSAIAQPSRTWPVGKKRAPGRQIADLDCSPPAFTA